VTFVPDYHQSPVTMLLRLGLFVSLLVSLSLSDCLLEEVKTKIEFNYLQSSGEIYIDRIEVKMKEGKFKDLISSGCSGEVRLKYKSQEMEQWKEITVSKRKKSVKTEKINPCEVYHLQMDVGGETSKIGSIGPYTDQDIDLTKVALKDEDFFENNKFTYQALINGDGQTRVSWNDFFCGKTKVVLYDDNGNEVCVQKEEDKFCIMTAEPCQDVDLEITIAIGDNEKQYDLVLSDQIRTITTFPDSSKLSSIFDQVIQTDDGYTQWDFSDFFNDETETDCIGRFGYKLTDDRGNDLGSQDELTRDNEPPSIRVNTADEMPCGGNLMMEVSYWLTGEDEKHLETFTKKVERTAPETAPSLSVSGTEITVTRASCDSADLQLRVEPKTDSPDQKPIGPFNVSEPTTNIGNIRDKMQPCVAYKATYSSQEVDIEVLPPEAVPTVELLTENDQIRLRVRPATTEDTCRFSNYKIRCLKEDSDPLDQDIENDVEIDFSEDDGNCTVLAVYEIWGDEDTIEKQVSEYFPVNNTKLILSSGEKPTTTTTNTTITTKEEAVETVDRVDLKPTPEKTKSEGSGSLPLVVGCVVGILAILIIAGAVYYLRKKPERVSTKAGTEKIEIDQEA